MLDKQPPARTTCTVCHNTTETKYLDLFVIGSEGLHVCHQCEMELCEVVQRMIGEKMVAKKMAVIERRKGVRNA